MKKHWAAALVLVLLATGALMAVAADSDGATHAYSRSYGPRSGFAMDAAFLRADTWDFRPLTGRPMISQPGDPVSGDVLVLSREVVRAGKLQVHGGEFSAILHREQVELKDGKIAVQYRWLGANRSTLAIVRGPAGSDAPHFQQAALVMQLEAAAAAAPTGIRVHNDEIAVEIFEGIHYSFDLVPEPDPNATEPLSQLGYATGGALLADADSIWNFSVVDTVYPDAASVAETTVPIRVCNGGINDGLSCDATDVLSCPDGSCDPAFNSTCNADLCGYSLPENDYVSRQESLNAGTCEGSNDSDNGVCCLIGVDACRGGNNPCAPCPMGTECDGGVCTEGCASGNACRPGTITAAQEREDTCFGGSNEGTPCPTGTECTGGGVCGETVWLRAGAQNEGGTSQTPNEGESRFCYDGQIDGAQSPSIPGFRGEVVQWEFRHPDGARRYMQLGDSWQSAPFECSIDLFNQACGVPLGGILPAQMQTEGIGFANEILAEGSVKLPSGHWFDALVVRQTADFSAFFASTNCGLFPLQEVLQPVILFIVPNLGSVIQINGPLQAADNSSWADINETRIRFGLFPPITTQVDSEGADSVTLSWTPGNQFGFIDRVKIYWDTDSGSASAYAFNSDTHPTQVSFGAGSPPTSATISGLTPGQAYFFSVTLLDSFTEFDGNPPVEYESLLFPQTASGTDDMGTLFTYPEEVSGTPVNPGCTPTTEVANLTVAPAGGGAFNFTWDAVVGDPCFDHYVLLGANDPSAAGNFTTISNTGTSTLFNGNPAFEYFLVVAEGAGGQRGPLGHYGQ